MAGDGTDCVFFKCLVTAKEKLSVAPTRLHCIVYSMLFPNLTKILELMSLHTKKTPLFKNDSKWCSLPTLWDRDEKRSPHPLTSDTIQTLLFENYT